jgi:hypothetical protein
MKAPAQYLRRSKHHPVDIDKLAVAIAHHQRYHADSFCMYAPETCTQVDETDIEYAEEMADVLRYLPEYPG